MHWIIAALSLAQVAQGLVPEVGDAQTGALKTFLGRSSIKETVQETTGSSLPDLDHQGIMHGDLLPPYHLNRRRLHTTRVRDARPTDPERTRGERTPRGEGSSANGGTRSGMTAAGGGTTSTVSKLSLAVNGGTAAMPAAMPEEAAEPAEVPMVEATTEPKTIKSALAAADPVTAASMVSTGNSGGFTQSGELTYYGGAGENGACSQTYVPPGYTTVAINQPQWKDGAECGTCVEGCFTNDFDDVGERCFKAIIDNLCPECASGDLDMGEDNGGRWDLQWKFIDCPSSDLTLLSEGGNKWYAKLKVQGGPSSITSMTCEYSGKSVDGAYTDDGFFEFWDRTEGTFACTGMSCTVNFSRGGSGAIEISKADLEGSFQC